MKESPASVVSRAPMPFSHLLTMARQGGYFRLSEFDKGASGQRGKDSYPKIRQPTIGNTKTVLNSPQTVCLPRIDVAVRIGYQYEVKHLQARASHENIDDDGRERKTDRGDHLRRSSIGAPLSTIQRDQQAKREPQTSPLI